MAFTAADTLISATFTFGFSAFIASCVLMVVAPIFAITPILGWVVGLFVSTHGFVLVFKKFHDDDREYTSAITSGINIFNTIIFGFAWPVVGISAVKTITSANGHLHKPFLFLVAFSFITAATTWLSIFVLWNLRGSKGGRGKSV